MGRGLEDMSPLVDPLQREIESMTRRLELEKRRLGHLDKELAAARKTYQTKSGQRTPRSARGGEGRRPSTATRPTAMDTAARSRSANGARAGSALPSRPSSVAGARSPSGAGGATERHKSPSLMPDGGAAQPADPSSLPLKQLLRRLEVQHSKLNGTKHDNGKLKDEIDHLRKQRLQYNTIFERLKSDIQQRTSQLAEFHEETIASQDVHNDAQMRVAVVKRQLGAERDQFTTNVRLIRKELQSVDFEKKEVELQLKRADHGVQKKRDLIVPEEESEFSENSMMRRIMKTAFLNCIQRRHIKQHQKDIEVFEQAFATIKTSTGIGNIEEIVRIFVGFESRNYSLMTYVNHMNREMEALEACRNGARGADAARRQQEELHEQKKHEALGDIQRHLRATQLAINLGRESYIQHRELLQQLQPHIAQAVQRVQQEFEELRKTSGPLPGDEPPRLPAELCEETIPEWLEWLEHALGRFRELLPAQGGAAEPFPATAAMAVKRLAPKKLHGPVQTMQLVKAQELPSAAGLTLDEQTLNAQKRGHAVGISSSQKADLLDEESEEEDFGDKPLMFKEIRSRAVQAAARRKRRQMKVSIAATDDVRLSPGSASKPPSPSFADPAGSAALFARGPRGTQRIERADSRMTELTEMDEEKRSDEPEAKNSSRDTLRNSVGSEEHTTMVDLLGGKAPKPAPSRRVSQLTLHIGKADGETNDEELDAVFLSRYKMTREELQVMADRMGIHLSNLCFLKQEFDHYDEDQSGYIDASELRGLLKKLGEELSDEELEAAFGDLDSDGSGEIEFFEFVEWFTSGE